MTTLPTTDKLILPINCKPVFQSGETTNKKQLLNLKESTQVIYVMFYTVGIIIYYV